MKIVFAVIAAFAAATVSAELRRDDKVSLHNWIRGSIFNSFFFEQWPPPQILEKLKPIRQVCQGKTGVTDGMWIF